MIWKRRAEKGGDIHLFYCSCNTLEATICRALELCELERGFFEVCLLDLESLSFGRVQ